MLGNLRQKPHSISNFKIHSVYVTQYKCKIFNSESLTLIKKSFGEVALKRDFKAPEFYEGAA